jgi:hypothetical protein
MASTEDFHHVTSRLIRRVLLAAPSAITRADLGAALSKTMRAVASDISNPHIPGPEMARRVDGVEAACEAMRRYRLAECHAALRGVWAGLKP